MKLQFDPNQSFQLDAVADVTHLFDGQPQGYRSTPSSIWARWRGSPPHFHARYGEYKVEITIETLSVIAGRLPPRALGLVMEWATLHRSELMEDWELARRQADLKKIAPLE